MAEDPLEASHWDDAVSSNPNAKYADIDDNIVNELSNTFAKGDISNGENVENDDNQNSSEDQEVNSAEADPTDVDTNEPKDSSNLLSTLTEGSDSGFIREALASPKKDESLFNDSAKAIHLPEADQANTSEHEEERDSTLSPTKVRRQNVYRAPRLRRVSSKSQKKHEGAREEDASDPLGPLGGSDEQKNTFESIAESPAEKILRQSEAPLFNINRTPLSPLKAASKDNQSTPIHIDNETNDKPDEQKVKKVQEPTIDLKISVGDPIKVGDLTSAHIVYSVRTHTESELLLSSPAVVSRRYRDFRWLYRQLQATHPGRIIPPPPEKQAVGRFNEEFIEGRRLALERMLLKISENPALQKDPDFIMFLQSERFPSEAREREKAVSSIFSEHDNDGLNNNSGFLSSIGFTFTPKIVEPDEYFKDKKSYIEALDQQFKILLRNLETVVVQRHDLASVTEEFASVITTLSDLEISKTATDLFQEFSKTQLRIKELLDRLSLQDMLTLGATLDEYQRVITSIQTTFHQRDKLLLHLSLSESDLQKKQASYGKTFKYNRTQTEKLKILKLEVEALEQKHNNIKVNLDNIGTIIKEELATFEIEKIHDFRNSIEIFLENTIESQKEAVELWETFYNNNLLSENE